MQANVIKPSTRDPSWDATRADLSRIAWVLGIVWLTLAGFAALVQQYLGWRLAVGLVGGAALLFTVGLLLVIGGTLGATSLERRWSARREQRQ